MQNEKQKNKENKQAENNTETFSPYMLLPDNGSSDMILMIEDSENEMGSEIKEKKLLNIKPQNQSRVCLLL